MTRGPRARRAASSSPTSPVGSRGRRTTDSAGQHSAQVDVVTGGAEDAGIAVVVDVDPAALRADGDPVGHELCLKLLAVECRELAHLARPWTPQPARPEGEHPDVLAWRPRPLRARLGRLRVIRALRRSRLS